MSMISKEKLKIYKRSYYLAHKEQARESTRRYHSTHKEEARKRNRKWRLEHKEYENTYKRAYYLAHKQHITTHAHIRWEILKERILTHCGNGQLSCVRCGELRMPCLSIDHINNNGAEHRRQVGSGVHFYHWLEKSDYPEGYQTLCMNCQFIKKHSLLDESR